MNLKKVFARLRMKKMFIKGEIYANLDVWRRKGLKTALRHAGLRKRVYEPWLRNRIAESGIFDRDFYISRYVHGDIVVDPFEHYIRRGIYYDLLPNGGFCPIWHRVTEMPFSSQLSAVLHCILNGGATHTDGEHQYERGHFSSRFLDVLNICRKFRLNLDRKSKFLDFGCGEGDTVAEFRSHGLDAYGYDIVSRLNDKAMPYREYFSFNEGAVPSDPKHPNVDDYTLADKNLILPFADNTFDVIFSYQVFEHVFNLEESLAEIARILKPGGVTWHIFPPESCFMERHTSVPLGHRIHKKWYYNLMGALGIAGRGRITGNPMERARKAYDYVGSATCYTSIKDLQTIAWRHFQDIGIHIWPEPPTMNPAKAVWRNLFPSDIILLCKKGSSHENENK